MNNGWIKTYRKTLDNPIVCKDADHLAVWMYLLWEATHSDHDSLFNGKRITLQPGQLITGRKTIAKKFNISESKVQRILKLFESEQQIEQQGGNKNRLVTVLNWEQYQQSEQQTEQQLNNNRTTSEQQVNTYKNERMKEWKKKEDVEANASFSSDKRTNQQNSIDYQALIKAFNEITEGVFGAVKYPISEKRKTSIRARIREHGKEGFNEMMHRAAKSNFLKGDNQRGWTASFDWMIRPSSFQKIIEGNYDNKIQQGNKSKLQGAQSITDEKLAAAIQRGTSRALKENARGD